MTVGVKQFFVPLSASTHLKEEETHNTIVHMGFRLLTTGCWLAVEHAMLEMQKIPILWTSKKFEVN